MITPDDNFIEYFMLAQTEALTARESRIMGLRYGFANGEPLTLEQVGQDMGISRERIRQILKRTHRKIYNKGKDLDIWTDNTLYSKKDKQQMRDGKSIRPRWSDMSVRS